MPEGQTPSPLDKSQPFVFPTSTGEAQKKPTPGAGGLRNQRIPGPSTRARPSEFTNEQLSNTASQDNPFYDDWQNANMEVPAAYSGLPNRANFSSVDLGDSLRRALDLNAKSGFNSKQAVPTSRKSSEDSGDTIKEAESSGEESILSSKATSTSSSVTRTTRRGQRDKRMFDKSGAPLQNIHLEQKKGPRPYSYHELRKKADLEAEWNAVISSPGPKQKLSDDTQSFPVQESPKQLEHDHNPKPRQRRNHHSGTSLQISPPVPRPEYARATSSESSQTKFTRRSTARDARDTRVRSSEPEASVKGSKKSSVASLDRRGSQLSEYQRSIPHSYLEETVAHDPNEDPVPKIASPTDRARSTRPVPTVPSPSPSEAQAQKPKRSLARLFSRSLATQPEEATSKEPHQGAAASASKSGVLGGYFKLHSGKRSNRSSEALQEKSKKVSEQPFDTNVAHSALSTAQSPVVQRPLLPPEQSYSHSRRHASQRSLDKGTITPAHPEPDLPSSFPATEAVKMKTPLSASGTKVQQYYFDFLGAPESPDQESPTLNSHDSRFAHHSVMTPGGGADRLGRRKASAMPMVPSLSIQRDEEALVVEDEKLEVEESGRPPTRFEIDVPDHLPSSPLCPLNYKKSNGSRPICPLHGRKKSPGRL